MIAIGGSDAGELVALLQAEAQRQAVTIWRDPFDLNLFAVRSAVRDGDVWDDVIGALWWAAEHPEQGSMIPNLRLFAATTDPGKVYRQQPMTSKGTAILCPGWHRGMYRRGIHGNPGYPALVQVSPAMFWRDRDKDDVLDDAASGPAKLELIGANLHRGDGAPRVGRYSAACQVTRFNAHLALVLSYVDAQVRAGHGEDVSYWLSDVRRSPSLSPFLAVPGLEAA